MKFLDAGDINAAEIRRRARRRYIERRAARTAPEDPEKSDSPWTVTEARIALDPTLTVPEAATQISRTASAVESLRARWRAGRLPAALEHQVPLPPAND